MQHPNPSAPTPPHGGEPFPREWLSTAVELSGVGSWALDLTTQRTEFSEAQRRLLGFEGGVTLEDVLGRIHPDDVEHVSASLKQCAEMGVPYEAEFRFTHPERGEIWLGGRASRVSHPETGQPFVVGVNFDVTRRRTAEIDAVEVSREMAHRMKNVFALVSGISRMISRTVDDVPSFATALAERMAALARLSDMTLSASQRGISLEELIDAALSPFDAGRIDRSVDEVRVNTAAAQTVLLAVNELATNAVKHGALRGPDGSVRIELMADEASDLFRLEWVEDAGRTIEPPTATGFGTQVLTRVTRNTYGGHPQLDYRPNGLHFRCEWELDRMTA